MRRLLGLAVTLAALALSVVSPADAAFPGRNGLIAYEGCGGICLVTGLIAWQYLVARHTVAAPAPAAT